MMFSANNFAVYAAILGGLTLTFLIFSGVVLGQEGKRRSGQSGVFRRFWRRQSQQDR
jgi:hypothetical protein